MGDQLLLQVGQRLGEQLRDTDMLARLGGDEFAILLDAVTRDQALAAAAKLRAALVVPFLLDGLPVRVDVSIGIALSPEHGTDLSQLLRRADIAMYRAKTARDGQRVYATADDPHGHDRLRTVQELRVALAQGQLTLHYQPKVDLDTGLVHGVEALVRWDHPTRGLLYPDSFLAARRESGSDA